MTTTSKDIIDGNTYTRKQVASMLHVSIATLDNYIRDGKLKAVKLGAKKVLITESDLNSFIEEQAKTK